MGVLFSRQLAAALILGTATLAGSALLSETPAAFAEGSRELVADVSNPANAAGNGGKRANLEWRADLFVNALRRRTLLQVYANSGDQLLLGSSAAGVDSGDIVVYTPGTLSTFSSTQAASLPSPAFSCTSSQPTKGHLTTRAQEIAGPLPSSGGYDPCVYTASQTGVYYVGFYGPLGANAQGLVDGDAGTIAAPVITSDQRSGVSLWDVTVRNPSAPSTDINGRVFTDYLAQLTGGNGAAFRVFSRLYALTRDGYQYQIDLRGLDPFGFVLYGSRTGNLDSDGVTPLYHDLYDGVNNDLSEPVGDTKLSLPDSRLFLNRPANDLPSSIAVTPTLPAVSGITFAGTAWTNNSLFGTGGIFVYTGNVGGISEIVVSRDGLNFDPTLPTNKVLRSDVPGGVNQLTWDGRANDGSYFPVGGPYPFKVRLHAGEMHFPLIDAENSPNGGPGITLLNPPGGTCPSSLFAFGCSTAYYDDRGYITVNGTTVGTPGDVLPTPLSDPSSGSPTVISSDPISGFDSVVSTQRAYGNGAFNGFGDKKALDIWAYYPSPSIQSDLNIVTESTPPPPPGPGDPAATPELGSVMLFGSGLFSAGSYAFARFRYRRRRRV